MRETPATLVVDNEDIMSYNMNSLSAMPEHITEAIFELLDLADRKSMSETCKKLNALFCRPKFLNKVWLNLANQPTRPRITRKVLKDSSRPYSEVSNFILNESIMDQKVMDYIAPNVKSLKIEFTFQYQRAKMSEYVLKNNLPLFINITHLQILSFEKSEKFVDDLYARGNNLKRVKLEHLRHLNIDRKFLEVLDEYHIDFSASEKLEEITFYAHSCDQMENNVRANYFRRSYEQSSRVYKHDNEQWRFYERKQLNQNSLKKIRDIIAKQKKLKSLVLHLGAEIFAEPLVVQSQLRELKFNLLSFMDVECEKNCLEFLESQDELKVLKVSTDKISPLNEQRWKQLRWKKLNMKLETMKINYFCKERNHNINTVCKEMLQGEPNIAVKELEIQIFEEETSDSSDIEVLFSLIFAKFPNLRFLTIQAWFPAQWNFPQLQNFNNLERLSILGRYRRLDSVSIPKLKFFGTEFSLDYVEHLERFLTRHPDIEILQFDYIIGISNRSTFTKYEKEKYVTPFLTMVDFALKNLKNLRQIIIKDDERAEWENCSFAIQAIKSSIIAHAISGFHLSSTTGLEISKQDDLKVVQMIEGRWKSNEMMDARRKFV